MQFEPLGRTGMMVSQLCFGTMSFGGDADEEMSGRMFRRCREAGINFFDTANIYQKGLAEEILGRLIESERDALIITSKVWGKMSDDPNDRGLSRRNIMLGCEASLRRLRTDRVEIYFCHHQDPLVPIEETLRAMDDLVRQGKILHPAVSNWTAWQTALGLGAAQRLGLARIECLQPMYNLVKRAAEIEILPLAQHEQIGVICYSPLGGGLLTGKYTKDRIPEKTRLQQNRMYLKRYGDEENFEVAAQFTEHARQHGVHPASLAVAWAGSHPAVTAPIIGARNVEQLEPSLKSVQIQMTPEWRQEISALSIDPPVATDRSEERS
jgi:aryl-alcohol dehydrogenase-like predicted oxidoreductase